MTLSPSRIRLEILDVPTPCTADWSRMKSVDGDTIRHCGHCSKNVYNLSAMTREKAAAFLADRFSSDTAELPCLRMFKRADGTLVTADCAGRWRNWTGGRTARFVGVICAAITVAMSAIGCQPGATMGTPQRVKPATTKPATQPATTPDSQPS